MMRLLPAFALFVFMLPAQALDWAGLWRTPDQRGEALLQRGDAAAAAKVYADQRRKAYAELRAGDYAGAARDLSAFDDSDADYNRGNALAHAGDLQGAISAYDAALKRDPHNQDAAHNRELVQNALKQPQQQQQDSSSSQSKQDKPGQGNPGQGDSGEQNNGDQNNSGRNNSGRNNSGQNGNNNSSAQGQDRQGRQQGSSPGAQGKPQQQGASSSQSGGPQPGQPAAGRDDAEQARRDVAAGLGQADPDKRDGQGGQNGNGALADSNQAGSIGAGRSGPPESEQQLAQDQWLRGIPDDPGGLLRRKFMIEYMMRQQKVNP